MPQVFKVGSYSIYFWSNENKPLEPIHVHISKGRARANGTKVWITRTKRCMIANNNSKIPEVILSRIVRIIEARADEIIDKWYSQFGQIDYFC